MKKSLLFLSLSLLLFGSCKKVDKCKTNVAKIAGSYKVTSAKYKSTPASTESDLLILLDACEKDDIEVLNENGSYTHQDAGTSCTPSGTYTGSWTLSGNSLTIDGEVSTITSFDCSTLVFTVSNYFTSGDVATFTLAKQ